MLINVSCCQLRFLAVKTQTSVQDDTLFGLLKMFMAKKYLTDGIKEVGSEFSRLWALFRKLLPWFLTAYIVHVLAFTVVALRGLSTELHLTAAAFSSLDASLIYVKLISLYTFTFWFSAVSFAPIIIVWGLLIYNLICLLPIAYRFCQVLLFPKDRKWQSQCARYHHTVKRWVGRQFMIVAYLILGSMAVLYWFSVNWTNPLYG